MIEYLRCWLSRVLFKLSVDVLPVRTRSRLITIVKMGYSWSEQFPGVLDRAVEAEATGQEYAIDVNISHCSIKIGGRT